MFDRPGKVEVVHLSSRSYCTVSAKFSRFSFFFDNFLPRFRITVILTASVHTVPYILRERKPTRTAFVTIGNDHTQHSYNLSIKGAIKSHGDIAIKALFTECSSLLGKSTFHPVSKKTLVA